MKTRFLFPYSFKRMGWIMLVPSCIVGLIVYFMDYQFPFLDVKVFAIAGSFPFSPRANFSLSDNNITDELLCILIIVGALFVACSEEKMEDEFIAQTRLESLLWATYINYILLLLAMIFVYGVEFFSVLVFNMFTHLLIFLLRFNYILYKNNKAIQYEK
ncbi:MAG: hypothetical protein NTU43_01500 [Bacteroidetes bacterium]|nr:hypothetical protein [Bacteroidota bacterium]